MRRKQFNKDFDEIGRKSRVKMHKSGKNWVRTVMSQLSLLRVMRGSSQESVSVSLPLVDSAERLESQRYQYLKAALASGAVVAGATVAPAAFAEELPIAVEQQLEETTDTVVDKNLIVVKTTATEVVSQDDASSVGQTDAVSLSTSISISESASASTSLSVSASESVSSSASVSASESTSTSLATETTAVEPTVTESASQLATQTATERTATIDYIVAYQNEEGTMVSGTAHKLSLTTTDTVAKTTVQIVAALPDGYQLAAGQEATLSQEVTENALNLITVKVVKEEAEASEQASALQEAKKVLEEVISEAEVLSADALRKAAKSTADTSSLQSAANATKAAAETANQVFADEHASLEDINAQITAIRTAVGNLVPELTSFTGTEEVTVMLAATTSGAADANQSGIDAISANNGQYTVTSENTNFKWTDIQANPIIALKMANGTYKYKKFSGTVTVDIAKEAYAADGFVDAAAYKEANGTLQATDQVYIIQESDFTTDPTSISIEESYDLTKFHHRQNLVLGGDNFFDGATIDDAASDSVLIALARPGSFVSEIEFKNASDPGTPSIYLPKENNTLLVVDNIREAVEQAGPNDQSYTNFGLFLSHIAVSDDKVNKPNTVMKLPEGVEVIFADSSGQQTTFAEAMNEMMAKLEYNEDEWKVLNPQQKLKFKFIVKKDGQIIKSDENWREITLHVYNTLDAVKNLVKTTLENTENNFAEGIVDNIDFSDLPEVMKNEAVEMEKKYPNVDGSTPQDGALPQFSNPTNKRYDWVNKDEETSNGNHATSPARYFPYDMDLFQGEGGKITEALRRYIPYIQDYKPGNGDDLGIAPSEHDKKLVPYYSLGPIFTRTMFGHNFTPEQGGVNESYWASLTQDAPIPQLDFEPTVNLDIVTLSDKPQPTEPTDSDSDSTSQSVSNSESASTSALTSASTSASTSALTSASTSASTSALTSAS
ncbi:TPA: accessory Sec-dependent serine-rich glycoprotein adhesin, partial [Streptococcus suis]|nr:accessory Sec-dependent serine-rich glycoprotein adhesin [Streptococcus suis]HEM6378735.1 accessory Sec-dependent serine-rich glycoprotein adhesin [Streptococcus suis]